MKRKPKWLTEAIVIGLHGESLAEFGGTPGLRDRGLLESAVARPQQLFAYGSNMTIFDLAAAYCVGIARNHPFIDGNKRAAFLAAAVFLDVNGWLLEAPETEVVEYVMAVAMGELDDAAIAPWLESHSRRSA